MENLDRMARYVEALKLCEEGRTRMYKEIGENVLNDYISIDIKLRDMMVLCSDIIGMMDQLSSFTRNVLTDLICPDFQQVSFLDVLNDYIYMLNTSMENLRFFIKVHPGINWEHLPPHVIVSLYRIIQEAIRNSIQHACAKNVRINIESNSTNLELVIKDDGKGFNVNDQHMGIGIEIIKNRTSLINGTVEIVSKKKIGTKIKIIYPKSNLE